jgi:GNAT superfamily N-acetyltransferase
MDIDIVEESADILKDYSRISIAFLVESRLRLEAIRNGLGGFNLIEEKIAPPYWKDYDQFEPPVSWPQKWDISKWGILSAFDGKTRVGGAAIAYDTQNVFMLEERKDVAVLWDIRIHPNFRGQGIGAKLFQYVIDWARDRGCRYLKSETQNINVPACRFYSKQGCALGSINRYAYTDQPDEIQLIWYKEIG